MWKNIVKSVFGSPRPPLEPFRDTVLGELKPGDTGWTVRESKGGESFEFTIGGANQPDARLLAHARDILNDFDTFKKAVKQCLESESRDYPEGVRAVIAELKIDNIALFWPERPDDGMIFFRGSTDDTGLWRCDYIARKPVGLGCDT